MEMSNSVQLDYLVNLMKNIAGLNKSCDVTLVAAKDKKKFPAHRLVLRASSKYFDALLGPMNEQNIALENIDGPTLEKIILYIYYGNITIDRRNVDAIIDAASSMQLIELQKRCVHFKLENLVTHNCIGTLLIADKYQLVDLKSKAFDMICTVYEEIPKKQIAMIDETNYIELLKSDQLSATESAVFSGLVNWLSTNNVEEPDAVAEFLRLIRLRHIQTQFLVDTVEPFFEEHSQRALISDEYRNRALHPNVEIDSSRCKPKNIHRFLFNGDYYTVAKYERKGKWTELGKIDIPMKSHAWIATVAKNKLYILAHDQVHMYAYDLGDFSRIELPNMNGRYSKPVAVVVGDYIYVFGPTDKAYSCERFDIENQVWTTRANMPIQFWPDHIDAIEHNGLIHFAFRYTYITTLLYCYDPVNDTWLLKTSIAKRAFFAKTSSSLYLIDINAENIGLISHSCVLQRYEPIGGVMTKIGDFNFGDSIHRTVEFNNEIYLLGYSKTFNKIDRENGQIVKLDSTGFRFFSYPLALYVQ